MPRHGSHGGPGLSPGYINSLAGSLADSASTTQDLTKTLRNGDTVSGSLTVVDSGAGDTGYSASWSGAVTETDGDTGKFSGEIVKVIDTSTDTTTISRTSTASDSDFGTRQVVVTETITGSGSTASDHLVETITFTDLDGDVTTVTKDVTFTGRTLTAGTITYDDGTVIDLTELGWFGRGGHGFDLFGSLL